MTKLKQVYAQKERQFQHELRKKEKEFEKLKDQLAAVLKDMQLREQKSEIHYNAQQSVKKADLSEVTFDDNDVSDEAVDVNISELPVDRVTEIENENDRLRQNISFMYGNLVQLIVDLFPELELDQSILALLETSPLEWIEEQLAHKTEELFEILRNNLANLALSHQSQKEKDDAILRLTSQLQAANSTVTSQNNTIKTLETQIQQYR